MRGEGGGLVLHYSDMAYVNLEGYVAMFKEQGVP